MKKKIEIERRKTRKIFVGSCAVGGDAPVSVQTMTNTKTHDIDATVAQILSAENEGCDLVRCAVIDESDANAIPKIKEKISIPFIADIHFNPQAAIWALEKGADAIRINPGNISSASAVKEIIQKAKECNTPIRIGINSGSLNKDVEARLGRTTQALVESALEFIDFFEKQDFYNLKVSIKSSDVYQMIAANRLLSERVDYPIHIGVTEAGTMKRGIIKSSIGIGTLLSEGIGDTIRVSLTENPVEEVRTGNMILHSLGLKSGFVQVISCPTCGRTAIDLEKYAREIETRYGHVKKDLVIAVMGCAVNGPGEAKEADIGMAGGDGQVVIFEKGKVLGTYPEKKGFYHFLDFIDKELSKK